jgi:hypothetical protein
VAGTDFLLSTAILHSSNSQRPMSALAFAESMISTS